MINKLGRFRVSKTGGRKPTYLTFATSVKAVSVVPSGSDKMDVRRENTDVRWVGFHPLVKNIFCIS